MMWVPVISHITRTHIEWERVPLGMIVTSSIRIFPFIYFSQHDDEKYLIIQPLDLHVSMKFKLWLFKVSFLIHLNKNKTIS